jgi:hypothetical protein
MKKQLGTYLGQDFEFEGDGVLNVSFGKVWGPTI